MLAAPARGAERTYSVTDFDRIQVEGPYVVRVVSGRPRRGARQRHGRRARPADDRRPEPDAAHPSQPVLYRRQSGRAGRAGDDRRSPRASLRPARLIGPGSLDIDRDPGPARRSDRRGRGPAPAASVAADTLNLGLLGAGRLELAGTAGTLRADVQGSGDLEAARLTAQNATITSDQLRRGHACGRRVR